MPREFAWQPPASITESNTAMADAPYTRQFIAWSTRPQLRAINNEYHLELTARNTADIAAGQVAQIRLQFEAAAANQKALGLIDASIRKTGERIGSGFDALSRELGYLGEQFGWLESSVVEGFDKVNRTLAGGFSLVADEIIQVVAAQEKQQITLNEIASTLSEPFGTEVKELLRKGHELLRLAETADGRERIDNWKDALLLFRDVTRNKIGASSCVAWFNIGWLQWKLDEAKQPAEDSFHNNPADRNATEWNGRSQAEQSFYNAQRFSAGARDLWHTKSLRHQAEMQYLLGKCEDAWLTANKALAVRREYETIYNAARYAAKTGRRDEVNALLDECINLRPSTIVTMFSEDDFLE